MGILLFRIIADGGGGGGGNGYPQWDNESCYKISFRTHLSHFSVETNLSNKSKFARDQTASWLRWWWPGKRRYSQIGAQVIVQQTERITRRNWVMKLRAESIDKNIKRHSRRVGLEEYKSISLLGKMTPGNYNVCNQSLSLSLLEIFHFNAMLKLLNTNNSFPLYS